MSGNLNLLALCDPSLAARAKAVCAVFHVLAGLTLTGNSAHGLGFFCVLCCGTKVLDGLLGILYPRTGIAHCQGLVKP